MEERPEILLVDDDAFHLDLMREAFEETNSNFKLISVKDGFEALEYLHRLGRYTAVKRPAMVFLDLNMPRKNGRQVLAEIKEDAELKDIPVTILSTSDSLEDVNQAYKLHANCYLTKPSNMDGLIKMVRTIEAFWFGTVALPYATNENTNFKHD